MSYGHRGSTASIADARSRTAIEQRQRWKSEDAMSIVYKVRDDTVSLTVDGDTGSMLSGPSRTFEFDDIIRASGPYKSVELKVGESCV